jgi:hypothetical protein
VLPRRNEVRCIDFMAHGHQGLYWEKLGVD